ncbi:alpha/beta hydrolase [Streptomyces sp. NPDC056660]|uniref:alpha/beta hydrolase n=1 Tax=Streptomyces sp. NPDC056660 TaxID=3345897 RepID=UPI00367FB473
MARFPARHRHRLGRHAVYGTDYGDACVNDTVNAFLATGRLPAADLTCAPVRPTRTAAR